MTNSVRLTEYSHGAGCGCKISPQVLDEILSVGQAGPTFPQLWVGNSSRDDAAVFGLDDERGIVSVESELSAGGEICDRASGRFVAVRPGHPAYHRW